MSAPICEDETEILTFEKRHQARLLHCCFKKSGMTSTDCWCCEAADDSGSLPCSNRTLVIDMTKIGPARYGFTETDPS
jgi:hypothetical protein